jgi:tRNA(Ile)-lysidine synthase
MGLLGPFEARPIIATAVSGGADSMALALLLDRWTRARGGAVIALTVDHRLRPEAGAEARRVGNWLAARGIGHRTLIWKRPKGVPTSALQAKAREERYRLLTGWCRRQGVLHLALAHHAGDQAETVLMRLARGAGFDGLAGMSQVLSRHGVRLIRPLLAVDPQRLRTGLAAMGQDWIEDPSNRDEGFERIRWRHLIPSGLQLPIAGAAAEIGQERCRRERALAELLARARLNPGQAELSLSLLLAAPPEQALAGLARLLMAVGGAPYPSRRESLERVLFNLAAGGPSRTLGGCRVVARRGRLLILAEKAAATAPSGRSPHQPLVPGAFTVAKLNVNIM